MPEAIALHEMAGCSRPVPFPAAGRPVSLVVITPCRRVELLPYVHDSIRFSIVTRWIIVFDADRVPREYLSAALVDDPRITLEAIQADDSRYGNAQRHFGLQIARAMSRGDDPLIYFLDDDNIVHPAFYELFQRFMWRQQVFYTFDQRRAWLTCCGRSCVRAMMDTAMICLPLSFCPDWKPGSTYEEDYYFIRSVMKEHGDRHVYVNQVGAYYNALQPRAVARLFGSHLRRYAIPAYLGGLITLAVVVRIILNGRWL